MRDQVVADPQRGDASSVLTTAEAATSLTSVLLSNGGWDNVFHAPDPDDHGEPDSKRRKLNSLCRSSSARLQLEFFQAGQQLAHPFQILLTPEMVRSIKASEFSVDTVLFFLAKMV